MAGDVVQKEAKGQGKVKKAKRVPIRIDMTPMVDVAFLLLTFFMLTTVFRKPQTMEINLPPDVEAKVEIAESNLLTLRVDQEGIIWYNTGTEALKSMKFAELRKLLIDWYGHPEKSDPRYNKNDEKRVTLVKVDREGTFRMMVDIIDELNLAKITRFTLAPMLPADKDMILKAKGG
jgi:biopolymer transport protein ExbD